MKELLELMKQYAERHGLVVSTFRLTFYGIEGVGVLKYGSIIIDFDSLSDLENKLKQ